LVLGWYGDVLWWYWDVLYDVSEANALEGNAAENGFELLESRLGSGE
jgi:hypothetical protein